jgi:hypothetical protein
MENKELSSTLKEIKELTDTVYRLKLEAEKADKAYSSAKMKLAEIMENAEVDKIQGDDCAASLSLKQSVSVPKDNKDKLDLFSYMGGEKVKTHLEELAKLSPDLFTKLTINARTFSSWYTEETKQKVLEGEFDFKLPMVKPHEYYSVGLRKRAVKKG